MMSAVGKGYWSEVVQCGSEVEMVQQQEQYSRGYWVQGPRGYCAVGVETTVQIDYIDTENYQWKTGPPSTERLLRSRGL